jgi:hypothetical protein
MYMKKSLSFLTAKMGVSIAENESNGGEEVTLARTIAADDDIVFRGEGLDNGLVLVAVFTIGSDDMPMGLV